MSERMVEIVDRSTSSTGAEKVKSEIFSLFMYGIDEPIVPMPRDLLKEKSNCCQR